MARMTTTAAGFRALMGATVEVDVVDISGNVSMTLLGKVWSPAPIRDLLSKRNPYGNLREPQAATRQRFNMGRADDRENVFVLVEGGHVLTAEVNVSTLKGYGLPLSGIRGASHNLTREEIAA